jgi:hypothetical protein
MPGLRSLAPSPGVRLKGYQWAQFASFRVNTEEPQQKAAGSRGARAGGRQSPG